MSRLVRSLAELGKMKRIYLFSTREATSPAMLFAQFNLFRVLKSLWISERASDPLIDYIVLLDIPPVNTS